MVLVRYPVTVLEIAAIATLLSSKLKNQNVIVKVHKLHCSLDTYLLLGLSYVYF